MAETELRHFKTGLCKLLHILALILGYDAVPGQGIRDMIQPDAGMDKHEGCGRCITPTLTLKLNEELNLKLPRRRVTVAETEGN